MGYLSIVKVQSWVWEIGPMLTDDDPKKKMVLLGTNISI